MDFASDFSWGKSLSLQLFSFKLFIFYLNFLLVDSEITICFIFGISIWSCFTFLYSTSWELVFGSPKTRRTNYKRNIKISFPMFFGTSLIRNSCFPSFFKKIFKLIEAWTIDYTYSTANTRRIFLRDLGLGLFYITRIISGIKALRRISAFVNYASCCLLPVFLFCCELFILLGVFSFVLSFFFCYTFSVSCCCKFFTVL